MTNRRALLMSLNSFSNFAIFTASVIFEPRKSKMMFCDCRRAVLKARFMVLALLPTGHFISHSKSFIRISGVLAPFCCSGGKSSISKPCSVKKNDCGIFVRVQDYTVRCYSPLFHQKNYTRTLVTHWFTVACQYLCCSRYHRENHHRPPKNRSPPRPVGFSICKKPNSPNPHLLEV